MSTPPFRVYPNDRSICMTKDGPIDHRFRIPGGTLRYNAERDARFPYIFQVKTHTLVRSEYFKTIWVHVVDTSIDARVARANFEKTLSVPLGPNCDMDHYGWSSNLIRSFNYFIILVQVYSNWNRVQYCLHGRLRMMVYTLKKTT
jgi:hypothetical protein